jgi:hypothetical protein
VAELLLRTNNKFATFICLEADCVSQPVVGAAVCAGVRRLLFRQAGEATTDLPHMFKYRAAATGPEALGLCDPAAGVDVEVDVVDAGARLRKGGATQAKDQDRQGMYVKAL